MTTNEVALLASSIAGGGATVSVIVGHMLTRRSVTKTWDKLEVIRIDVNSRMTAALDRIASLEQSLGLAHGEAAPAPDLVTVESLRARIDSLEQQLRTSRSASSHTE